MSSCRQNGQGDDEHTADEAAPARDNYKQKPASKVVRVLTVLAYLLSVSLAAILLSIYYVCVWKSPELPPLNNTEEFSARVNGYSRYSQTDLNFNGNGSGTSIDVTDVQPLVNATTPDFTNSGEQEILTSDSTLIPTILPYVKQTSTNKTLRNIGTFNESDSIT